MTRPRRQVRRASRNTGSGPPQRAGPALVLTPKRGGPLPIDQPRERIRRCQSLPEPSKVAKAAGTPACRQASTTPGRTWPVLTAEATPRIDTSSWTFRVEGLVANPTTWTWDQIHALPGSTYQGDIHCVTTWSKLGMTFTGVSVDALLGAAEPLAQASYVLAFSHSGYTTNLPLADVTRRPGLGGLGGGRRTPCPRARRASPAPRPPPVLLEKRQMGRRAAPGRPRRARLLGTERIPRPRRPLARTALPRRLSPTMAWEPATVVAIGDETARAKTFRLRLSRPRAHLAGQHYILRLSAPDGYSAQRSYSVASAPDGSAEIELTIERLPGGEVSMFMHDEVRVGDELEAARPHRQMVRVARRYPCPANWGRVRHRTAHGDAAPSPAPRRTRPRPVGGLGPHTPGPLLRQRTARARGNGRLHPGRPVAPPQATRSHHPGRPRAAPDARRHRLHLRLIALRRCCHRRRRRRRRSRWENPGRTVRRYRLGLRPCRANLESFNTDRRAEVPPAVPI